MALKYKIKTREEIPAELQSLYVERDGGFVLDAEGVADKSKLDEFRTGNVALKKELEEFKARFDGIDPEAVRRYLAALPGVTEVHDLHIWAMSTTETALTAHLVMPVNSCAAHFLGSVCNELHQRFRIDHPTLQVEPTDAPDRCRQAAEESV